MRTSVLNTVLAVALVVGSACKGPDNSNEDFVHFTFVVRGANVLPQPADTTPEGFGVLNTETLGWAFTVTSPPASGTIDSIAIYTMPATAANCATTTCSTTGTPAPGATNSVATAILCAGAAACAAGTGTATLVGTTTNAQLGTLLRAYGGQVIVFTTTVRSGGVMRGTAYLDPV